MLKDISDLEAGDQKVLEISCDFTKGERVVVTDLTKEHPNKTLWRFLLPMMLSVMFQQIYNIADSMIAGKFAGEDALAAVGASYPITVIFMAFAVGMNLGTSVIVSRLFGAGDRKGVKRAVTAAFAASGALGIALTVFGCVACRSMMVWIRTPENILADGELYLKIYVFGLLFLMLYNVCTGVCTALGDSKTPLYFLLGSSAGNILLDFLFVFIILKLVVQLIRKTLQPGDKAFLVNADAGMAVNMFQIFHIILLCLKHSVIGLL